MKCLDDKMHAQNWVGSKNQKGLPDKLKFLHWKNQEIKAYRHPSNILNDPCLADKHTIIMLSTWHDADITKILCTIKEDIENQQLSVTTLGKWGQ